MKKQVKTKQKKSKQVKKAKPVKQNIQLKQKEVKLPKHDKLNTLDIRKPSKSLKVIRVSTMIAKVLSMIIFVIAIIGTLGCTILSILFITQRDVIYSVQTFQNFYWNQYGISVYSMSYFYLTIGCACAGAIAIGWFAWLFFGRIYKNGTPFTYKSAREAVRLAIICGGTLIAGGIIYGVFGIAYRATFTGTDATGFVNMLGYPVVAKFVSGIIYLVMSFVFRHGAELREANYSRA